MKELAELACVLCLIVEIILNKNVIITLYRQSKDCLGMWLCASAMSIMVYLIILYVFNYYELAFILAFLGTVRTMYRETNNHFKN